MSEVFDRYTDTAGNEHWSDTETGHHVIPKINLIEGLSSAQPERKTDGDTISRQAAFDIINVYAERIHGYIGTPNDSEVYAYARGLLLSIERNIRALPSTHSEQNAYEQGKIAGRVEMRTEILSALKKLVGSEVWNNI